MAIRPQRIIDALTRALGRTVLALPLAWAAPSLSAVSVPGCGCSGGLEAAVGIAVTVVDETSGQRVCDATVIARDGDHSETLVPITATGACYYVGAGDRPGTYTIEVALAGRTASVQGVQVKRDGCHVATTPLDVTLPAASAS
jgi:hypothetical protein